MPRKMIVIDEEVIDAIRYTGNDTPKSIRAYYGILTLLEALKKNKKVVEVNYRLVDEVIEETRMVVRNCIDNGGTFFDDEEILTRLRKGFHRQHVGIDAVKGLLSDHYKRNPWFQTLCRTDDELYQRILFHLWIEFYLKDKTPQPNLDESDADTVMDEIKTQLLPSERKLLEDYEIRSAFRIVFTTKLPHLPPHREVRHGKDDARAVSQKILRTREAHRRTKE